MSELIDRIFDAEKISAEVGQVLSNLQKVTSEINNLKDAVKANEAEIRKAKGSEQLAEGTKKLNDNVIQGGKAMKTWQDEVAKLQEKTKQLTETEKAASIEIAKARLELQAAQKATKEAAIAEIEATAATGKLTGSYNELDKSLKAAQIAYKNLSAEERNSAKGTELLKKIQEIQTSLKATDAAMGNFQRNVGNYSSAIDGLSKNSITGIKIELGMLQDKLNGLDINSKEFKETKDQVDNLSLSIQQAEGKVDEFGNREPKNKAKKEFEDTLVTVGILSGTIGALSEAFSDNEGVQEALVKTQKALVISQSIANVVKEKGAIIDTIVLVKEKALAAGKIVLTNLTRIFGLTSAQAWAAATLGVSLLITGITLLIANFDSVISSLKSFFGITNEFAATEAKVKSLTKALDGFKESTDLIAGRMKAEGKSDQEIFDYKKKRYLEELELNRNRYKELKKITRKLTDDEKSQLEESAQFIKNSTAKKYELQTEQIQITRDANKKISDDNEKRSNERIKKENETAQKILEANRRLEDSRIALMADGVEKEVAISNKNFERQIKDSKAEGELKENLIKQQQNAEQKIRDKYSKDAIEKAYQDFQKNLNSQTEALSREYAIREKNLKKQYADGLITEKEYQEALTELKLTALIDTNYKTIAALKEQLKNSELTKEQRLELSNKLKDLEIQNENAVVDATIKANEDKVKSDQEAIAKRIEIANALGQATMEIFGAIANYQKQQSDNRIAGYEKEQEQSDSTFAKQQENLDNALMSDEARALKQKELNEKKAAADKAIADKIQAEKVKQAKWEKANAIVQAIISAGLAILNASKTEPFIPMGLIAAGLATTMGAIQVATIASQQIPAYEKGTDNHPGGLSLWGEKRPEVAVTQMGDILLAEKPTISNFDAGTKIYKSVSDFENYLAKKSINQMVFDYDKFGEKMPHTNINLDSRGLWEIVSKQGSRRTLINRRYRI